MQPQEIKNNVVHYHLDKHGLIQGEYKSWYNNKQQESQMCYKDDEPFGPAIWWYENGQLAQQCTFSGIRELHGEYKEWLNTGEQTQHHFLYYGAYVTDEIATLVNDIANLSEADAILLKLKYGHDFGLFDH